MEFNEAFAKLTSAMTLRSTGFALLLSYLMDEGHLNKTVAENLINIGEKEVELLGEVVKAGAAGDFGTKGAWTDEIV